MLWDVEPGYSHSYWYILL